MKISVLSFRPNQNAQLSSEFSFGHKKVLSDFGIENVTSNTELWKLSPNVHSIIAKNQSDNQVVGGIRIHVLDSIEDLPIQQALGYLEPKLHNWLFQHDIEKTAEVCGLWNSKKVFGRGISVVLTRAAVAYGTLINLKTLIGLAAPYTREMSESMGFRIVPELGLSGTFLYPNERHTASIMKISDLSQTLHSSEDNGLRIKSLVKNPHQYCVEEYNGSQLEIDYNLL